MGRPITPLRRALFESGLTQRDLAKAIGVSESHVSLILSGKRYADRELRDKIAVAVGREPHELESSYAEASVA